MHYNYNNYQQNINKNITFKGNKKPMVKELDINSRAPYPSCTLSNFAKTSFELDGVQINSMEGFIQSLKVPDVKRQKEICKMSGPEAKKLSKTLENENDKLCFFQGKLFKKCSDEYNTLIKDVMDTYQRTRTKPFEYKGYNVYSVNSFITALTVNNETRQRRLFAMNETTLNEAMKKEKTHYSHTRILYWQGKEYRRDSNEYANLLDRAYNARFVADEKFRDAIHDTEGAILTHRKGNSDPSATILTTKEFLSHIISLRKHILK